MSSKLIITPSCSDPENKQSGVIIKNFFVPTYEAPGMVIDCGIFPNTKEPTMQVTWNNYSSFSGTYKKMTDKTHTYFQHTDRSYCVIARYASNTNRWCIGDYGVNSSGLYDGWAYCYNDNGNYDYCPKTGWYDNYYQGSIDNNIVTDIFPETIQTLQVTNCGPNASYIFDYVAGLNVNQQCNQVLREQKTTVNYWTGMNNLTTSDITNYVADVTVVDTMNESEPDYIYRCDFSTGRIRRIPYNKYVAPTYTVIS